MKNTAGLAISLIAILAVLTTASMSLPAVYAKKHHLSDTQKEDSTASDKQGNTCNFGPDHDQCRDQYLESQGFHPLKPDEHFGDCQPSEHKGLDCEIINDNDS